MGRIIDGKACAEEIRARLKDTIGARTAEGKRPPGLVTVLVGEDPASQVYVGRKQRQAGEVGMFSEHVELPADATIEQVLDTVRRFNAREDIDGILVQLPLPSHLDSDRVIAEIDPSKDVDGLHPVSQGALFTGRPGLRPCTPMSCLYLLDHAGVDPKGLDAVVVGRSVLVGKPVAMLLLERHATVTLCHSRTRDLAARVAAADIVIAAIGSPERIPGAWIKPGATVIDVGINRVDGKLVGDVEFGPAAERADWITPVPGGVGPMTVAMLLQNTYEAAIAREVAGATG